MAAQHHANEYVYVTGCDTGFGNILTKKLDGLGYSVFAGVFMEESVERLKKECSDRVIPLRLDVSDEASVEKVGQFIAEFLESRPSAKLHGVVNNAGVLITPGPAEWTPNSSYRRMFDVNVMGTVMVTKSVLPLIRKSQGRIVNVASIAGRVGLPSEPAYCISKYAVEAYSDVLRKDMYPWNVTVSIIEPGVFSKTALYGNYQTGLDNLWDNLPEKLKAEYGFEYYQWFRKLMGIALVDFNNSNSNLVPEAMLDALTSKQPKFRYRVGIDSKYVITPLTMLHESVQDFLLTRTDGRNPEVRPAAAPKHGKEMCRKRYPGAPYKYWILVLALFWLYRRYLKR